MADRPPPFLLGRRPHIAAVGEFRSHPPRPQKLRFDAPCSPAPCTLYPGGWLAGVACANHHLGEFNMRWKGGRRSQNVEDRRGTRMGRGAAVGGVGGLGFLVIVVLYVVLGGDPAQLVEQMPQAGGPSASTTTGPPPPGQEELADFVSVVLADTEDTWNPIFASIGYTYEEPKLVLFTDQVRSACGMAGAAMGPFYCPGDHKLYIDLSFL